MMERLPGTNNAAPAPCTARATMSCCTLGAKPHHAEAAVKKITPAPNTRTRRRWLPAKITVRSATPHKRMRLAWNDATIAELGFLSKGPAKSVVAVRHSKLPDKSAAAAMKTAWAEHFGRLAEMLS